MDYQGERIVKMQLAFYRGPDKPCTGGTGKRSKGLGSLFSCLTFQRHLRSALDAKDLGCSPGISPGLGWPSSPIFQRPSGLVAPCPQPGGPRRPWLPISGDGEEAGRDSQAPAPPHAARPPSRACPPARSSWLLAWKAVPHTLLRALAPRPPRLPCSPLGDSGPAEAPLPGPLPSHTTRPPFPGPAALPSLAGGPSWLTDSGSVTFFLPARAQTGWSRRGRSRAVVSLPIPRAPPNFLVAGLRGPEGAAEPSHLKNQLVTSKLKKCNAEVTRRGTREPCGLCHLHGVALPGPL